MAGAPARLTPAQYKQYLHFLKTHHFTKAQRRAFNKRKAHNKHTGHLKHHAARIPHSGRTVGAPLAVAGGEWILGGNDTEPTCAAVAVANSLLAWTGVRASDEDILALHQIAGGVPFGARISDVLRALMDYGLSGARPADVSAGDPSGDLIISIGSHAACIHDSGLITWGAMIPADGIEPDEAWSIRWD